MSGQAGIGFEPNAGAWGVSQTPTVFLPIRSVRPTYDPGLILSQAVRAGQIAEDHGYPGAIKASVQTQVELMTSGIAKLLTHLVGAVTVDDALDPIFENTYNLAAPTTGLTFQWGSEDTAGVVHPYTLLGGMVDTWSLATSVSDGIALLDMTIPGKDIVKTTPLASASYPVAVPWTFPQTTLTVGGSPFMTATSATVSVTKGLNATRHHLGARTINKQRNVQRWKKTATFAAEFESDSMFDHLVGLDDVALVQTWDDGDGNTLEVTANIQVTGDAPGVTTQGIEPQTVAARICRPVDGDDADAITVVLTNTEDASA